MRIALNLKIKLGRSDILVILSFSNQTHGKSLHLFKSSFLSSQLCRFPPIDPVPILLGLHPSISFLGC